MGLAHLRVDDGALASHDGAAAVGGPEGALVFAVVVVLGHHAGEGHREDVYAAPTLN